MYYFYLYIRAPIDSSDFLSLTGLLCLNKSVLLLLIHLLVHMHQENRTRNRSKKCKCKQALRNQAQFFLTKKRKYQ